MVKEVCGIARMLKEKPVDRLAQKSFFRERDYIEWLRKCRTVDGKKSTNAFAVFKDVRRGICVSNCVLGRYYLYIYYVLN